MPISVAIGSTWDDEPKEARRSARRGARRSKLCASQLGHDGHAAWLRDLGGTAVNAQCAMRPLSELLGTLLANVHLFLGRCTRRCSQRCSQHPTSETPRRGRRRISYVGPPIISPIQYLHRDCVQNEYLHREYRRTTAYQGRYRDMGLPERHALYRALQHSHYLAIQVQQGPDKATPGNVRRDPIVRWTPGIRTASIEAPYRP